MRALASMAMFLVSMSTLTFQELWKIDQIQKWALAPKTLSTLCSNILARVNFFEHFKDSGEHLLRVVMDFTICHPTASI